MSANIEVEKIGQIAIAISDLKKSVQFYQDILGLELLFEVPTGLAFFDCGGTRLMLTTLQGKEEDHNTSTIYYKVSDIHSTTQLLQNKGVTFEREPQLAAKMADHELWIGFLRDPDNNLVGIMAELPLA
ncbi:MAG: VOC family protein [Algicola sp.]|nr:VOC family protein [Algicola sp.]